MQEEDRSMRQKVKAWKKICLGAFTGLCILGMQFVHVKAETTYTCKYNGASYTSLAAAVNAAKANEPEEAEIIMCTDETLTKAVVLDEKHFTLDLAGHNIDFPKANKTTGIQVNSDAKLTLEDSVGEGKISVVNGSYGVIYVNNGELVVNNGTLAGSNESATADSHGIYAYNGKITVNSGKITGKFPLYFTAKNGNEVQLNITGGSFEGTKNCYMIGDVVARISGGTFMASDDDEALNIEMMNYDGYDIADVKISGGSFHASVAGISIYNWKGSSSVKDIIAENGVLSDETSKVNGEKVYSANNLVVYTKLTESDIMVSSIEDAYYTGEAVTPEPTITYNGKVLEKDTDYTLNYANNTEIGTATVNIAFLQPYLGSFSRNFSIIKKPDTCVANGVGYSSFAEAVAAIPENGTAKITMVANETASENVYLGDGKDITLDLAGFDLEFPDCDYAAALCVRTKFTLEDSVGDGTISAGNINYGVIGVWVDGNFVMNGGNIVTHKNPSEVLTGVFCNDGSATINGGTISIKKPIHVYGRLGATEVTINGGKFEGAMPSSIIGNSKVEINGGEFYGIIEQALNIDMTEMANGVPEVKISGGTFTGTKYGIIFWGIEYYEDRILGLNDLLAEGCVWSDDTQTEYSKWVLATAPTVSVYRVLAENDVVVNDIENMTYTGNAITPVPVISYNGKVLTNGTDYVVSYVNNVEVGTATIKIDFQSSYTGSITKTFQILEKPVNASADENASTEQPSDDLALNNVNPQNPAEQPADDTASDVENADVLKVGDIVYTKSAIYKITKITTKEKTAEFVSPAKKNVKIIKIPATIKQKGTELKVTSIAANACKNNKKLTTLTIGKNVKTIGKQAFYGCKKLKNITIKTTKLTNKSVGKKAFAGTAKNAKVKVPQKKLNAYKKILVKKGIAKKATIKK